MTGGTISGGEPFEVVLVHVLGFRPRDDLVPLDGLDVAQVVVVQDANASLDNV